MKRVLIGLFFLLIFNGSAFSADFYSVGVDAFKKGAYDKSASNLEHAVRINPKNVNARYYLAQVYILLGRNSDAVNQYNRIIILAPSSDAAILSQKGLALMVAPSNVKGLSIQDEYSAYKDNYIDYVMTSDGKIERWASFPLSVYIESKAQKEYVKKAFEQWRIKSKNLARFAYVQNPAQADITVDFKTKLESTSTQEAYIAGYSKPYYTKGRMTKSEIHLLSTNPATGEPMDNETITATALHEIGHSLGFVGHSPDENDVMYASSKNPKLELSQRDINTLLLFYKISDSVLQARRTGSSDLKFQQAVDYVKKEPNKSVGWVNLGDIYRGKKMYSEAIKNYKKAIELEPDKADVYNIVGVTYQSMGNYNEAYSYAKKACDMDKSNTFYVTTFASICLKGGYKSVGKNYLDSFVKSNPQALSDSDIQKMMEAYK